MVMPASVFRSAAWLWIWILSLAASAGDGVGMYGTCVLFVDIYRQLFGECMINIRHTCRYMGD